MGSERRKLRRILPVSLAGVMLACMVVAAILALMNRRLPTGSQVVEQLDTLEKARLAEAFHLRQTLGDAAWPGWGQADIPAIVYNERYAFLVGLPDPSPGWFKAPGRQQFGSRWQVVPGDTFAGQTYYRQQLPDDITPEAFTVLVGDRWVSSLATKEWLVIDLASQFRKDLPPVIDAIFPYWLATNLFVGSSDFYITGLLHESFHAYQGMVAAQKLAAAETAVPRYEADYPWDDPALRAAWQAELDLLAQALEAGSEADLVERTQQFLDQRRQRRDGLASGLVAYEQQREWLEGLARYVELEIWRQAAGTPGYQPTTAVTADPDFKHYTTFSRRWSQEVDQMRRMAGDRGGGRFYYSGMAQAVLLDRLAPGWKEQIMAEGVFLETLLNDESGREK